jgi:uncharacterized protein YjbI with pentapeptide repeats
MNSPRTTERLLTPSEKSRLHCTVLRDAEMSEVDFSEADLRGSRFERVNFSCSDFRRANLVGVSFFDCDLRETDFADAQLGLNSFLGSCLSSALGLSPRQSNYVVACGGNFSTSGPGKHRDR